MNTNSIARITNNLRINTLNNSNLNNINSSLNSFVKEDTSMKVNTNPVSRIARSARCAAVSLLAVGGLLTLSHTAHADIEVYRFVPPAQALFVPAGSTYMEVKVGNTSNFAVSGLQITVPLDTPALAQLHGLPDYYDVTSEVFSLGPNESKWIYIPVPARGMMGTPLYGKTLSGNVWINEHIYQNVSFQDVAAAANVQSSVKSVGQNNGTDVFTVTFTNNGYANAPAQKATVSTWLYAEGKISTAYNQAVNLPALAVGQSYTVRLSTQQTQGYQIYGNVQIGTNPVSEFFL